MRQHLSFFFMVASSASLFLSNILAKNYFSTESYLTFSYFLTTASILSSFALIGSEQLIIRYGSIDRGRILMDRDVIIAVFIFFIIAVFLSKPVLDLIYKHKIPLEAAISTTIAFCLTLVNYNLLRLKQEFVLSMLSNGAWRLLTLIVVIVWVFGGISDSDDFGKLIVYSTIVVNAVLLFMLMSNIVVTKSGQRFFSNAIAFSFSLFIMTLLGSFDRVLAERSGDSSLFSEYVYYSMVLIMPFNMIASYIGFREAVFFKTNFSKKILVSKVAKVLAIVSGFYLIALFILTTAAEFVSIEISVSAAIATFFLVTTKSVYSLLSSVMGARGMPRNIWVSNIFSLLAIVIIYFLFMAISSITTIESILWLFVVLWASRTIVFAFLLPSK